MEKGLCSAQVEGCVISWEPTARVCSTLWWLLSTVGLLLSSPPGPRSCLRANDYCRWLVAWPGWAGESGLFALTMKVCQRRSLVKSQVRNSSHRYLFSHASPSEPSSQSQAPASSDSEWQNQAGLGTSYKATQGLLCLWSAMLPFCDMMPFRKSHQVGAQDVTKLEFKM